MSGTVVESGFAEKQRLNNEPRIESWFPSSSLGTDPAAAPASTVRVTISPW
jgi:hypothetical protein